MYIQKADDNYCLTANKNQNRTLLSVFFNLFSIHYIVRNRSIKKIIGKKNCLFKTNRHRMCTKKQCKFFEKNNLINNNNILNKTHQICLR